MNAKVNKNTGSQILNKANSMESFYDDTAILVTGATGFVGKGVLEKLFRLCPNIAAIFVLIRPKKDQTIQQRFKKLLDDPIYDSVRAIRPSVLNKIHPVEGDVSLPDLGLSPADRIMLIENVNIVFHLAATVKFNEPLNMAVNINTSGTARVIQLCRELKNAISVIHVSTAYSNADLSEIEEKVYTTCLTPSAVIDICESEDNILIDLLEERILKIYPNTYTFTKNLAEQIVFNNSDCLPIAIVRPSIIGASQKEPCPGWVDNISGVTETALITENRTLFLTQFNVAAVLLQIGKGVLKVSTAKKDAKLDLVPVDYVVDTIICAAWHITLHRENNPKVYNCTSNAAPLSWCMLRDIYVECSIKMPMNDILWYPYCVLVANRFVYNILKIFLHVLPAFVMDIFLKFRGKKPMMMKISRYSNQILRVLQYFSNREWGFHRNNITDMMNVMTLKDRNIVKLDLQDMDWKKYITNYQMGMKKFLLRENSESTNAARRLSLFYWIHQVTQLFGVMVLSAIIAFIIYNVISMDFNDRSST